MSKLFRSNPALLRDLFLVSLLVTLLVYILRGLGLLSFLPGGVILGLIFLLVVTGILYGIDKTSRL